MPKITIWNGEEQSFGGLGTPQRWVNIPGNVTGGEALSLTCSLNGGPPLTLNIGPDRFRLASPGDFNADIPVSALRDGLNSVRFQAVDSTGATDEREVSLNYHASQRWPLPYSVPWKDVRSIPDAVQVVDGLWDLTSAGIRPRIAAYDRLVTLGDQTWQDYEITVTATIHGFGTGAAGTLGSSGPLRGGFGILTRWSGHRPDEHQPHREWRPNGTIGWYRARWEDNPARTRCLNISDAVIQDRVMVESPALELELDVPHVYQMRVESRPADPSLYHFRVWRADRPDQMLCDLATPGTEGEASHGSILLIALCVDLTIGDISVRPISV